MKAAHPESQPSAATTATISTAADVLVGWLSIAREMMEDPDGVKSRTKDDLAFDLRRVESEIRQLFAAADTRELAYPRP